MFNSLKNSFYNLYKFPPLYKYEDLTKYNFVLKNGDNLTIIEKDCMTIFEKNRITKIDTEGKKFDPNLHQAMTEIEDLKSEPGTIVQEIQKGYMLSNRLLRPALVAVAKKNSMKNEENKDKKEEK